MALTTLADLEERLAITGTNPADIPDAYLNNLIDRASAAINSLIGHPIEYAASTTEYYDGTGGKYLELRRGPLVAISNLWEVTYDSAGSESTDALTENVDYWIKGDTTDVSSWKLASYLVKQYDHWTVGVKNYKVTYSSGFLVVPDDIGEACLVLCVAQWNKRKDTTTSARDIGDGSIGSFLTEAQVNDDVRRLVGPYIDHRVL